MRWLGARWVYDLHCVAVPLQAPPVWHPKRKVVPQSYVRQVNQDCLLVREPAGLLITL